MRFTASKIRFGSRPVGEDDEGQDLPRPHMLKLQARRAAGIREAADILDQLPGPGESLHAVMTARLDMSDILNALLGKIGRCERARIATLGYNRRNFRTMLSWLDAGAIGSLSLVASLFFRSHNGDLWQETLDELRGRGHRAVCCPCHAKVMSLEFANGDKLAIEGSANLCSNGSAREQFSLIHDAALCSWHGSWVSALIDKYDGNQETNG
jgi:hypothetical protein